MQPRFGLSGREVSKGTVLPETPIAPGAVVSRRIDFFNLRAGIVVAHHYLTDL